MLQGLHEMRARPAEGEPMAADLLTASQVSTRLGVDRSTIYRMAMDGRLGAVKVGAQWRFPPQALEQILSAHVEGPSSRGQAVVPLRAARESILRAVAPMLEVAMVVTDMDGHPVTDIVNPCPWFTTHSGDPGVFEACTTQWRAMAADAEFTPRLQGGSHGFECVRSFVREGDKLVGLVVAGGIAPETDGEVAATAAGLHVLDTRQRAQLVSQLPRVAAALSALTTPPSHQSRSTT